MEYHTLPTELQDYIEKIHKESYIFLIDMCVQKCLKVARKAKELGLSSDVVFCFAQTPKWLRWIYPYNPHVYLVVDGVKVDLFYANWWNTGGNTDGNIGRKTICSVRLFTIRAHTVNIQERR